MLFSLVSAVFQSTIGADFDGSDAFTQSICAFLRAILLAATFVLCTHTFKARKSQKVHSLPCITKGSPRTHSSHNRYAKKVRAPSTDDDDDLSTSVGSSDSESDTVSSDNESEVRSTTKISVVDILSLRPSAGPAPNGSLRAMPVVERGVVRCQHFEQRQWENLRSSGAPANVSKTAPAKQPSKTIANSAKKVPKAAPVKTELPPVDAATAAANSKRMAALLEIICPEDIPGAAEKTSPSRVTPPWRQRQAA